MTGNAHNGWVSVLSGLERLLNEGEIDGNEAFMVIQNLGLKMIGTDGKTWAKFSEPDIHIHVENTLKGEVSYQKPHQNFRGK